MREEHNECAFPCDVERCDRVGRRGYFREKDMIKHRREAHPDADSYQPTERQLKYRCTEPGCGALLDPSSAKNHQLSHVYKGKQLEVEASVNCPLVAVTRDPQGMFEGSNEMNSLPEFEN